MSTSTPTRETPGPPGDELDEQRFLQHTDWVAAAPFRAHLRHLLESSQLPWRALARHCGLPRSFVRQLLLGRGGRPLQRIHPMLAHRLLAVDPTELRLLAVELCAAHRLTPALDELRANGLDEAAIARLLRLPAVELAALRSGRQRTTTRRTVLLARAAVESFEERRTGARIPPRRASATAA